MGDEKIFFSSKQPVEQIRFIPEDEFEWLADIKHVEKEAGDQLFIAGYANTKNLDRVGDIVEPSAFDGTIQSWKRSGVILFAHNHEMPIGRPVEAKRDEEGFWIKALISNADDVRSIRQKIEERILRSLSIGFRILKDKWDELDGTQIRRILKLELFEVSVVPVPANRESTFDVVKSMQLVPTWKQKGLYVPEDSETSIDDGKMFSHSLKVVEEMNAEIESETIGESIRKLEVFNQKFKRGT